MTLTLELSSTNDTPIFTLKSRNPNLKAVYGAIYHGKTQSWWFPAFYPVHEYVLSDLKKLVPDLQMSDGVVRHLDDIANYAGIPSDFTFITPPYDHQKEGVDHLYRNIRAGLFYDPGLGKCKITIDLQRLIDEPMLIICPRIMLDTWADEFVKHGNTTNTLVISGATKKKKLEQIKQATEKTPVATILTYGVASLYHEDILRVNYKAIVIDESHRIKQPYSKRTQAVTALAQRAYRRILLSGTPSLGSPFDMYGQLRCLGKYFCPEHWWAFRKKFGVFPPHEAEVAVPKILVGFKNLDLMNKRVNLVCNRKTRDECLDLPERTVVDLPFALGSTQKTLYNTLITDRAYGAGVTINQALVEGTLNHTSGAALPPYVIATETVTLLNKLDQVSSGFLYLTTKNPAICDGCSQMALCSQNNIKPYTAHCSFVKKEVPADAHVTKDNARLERCMDLLEDLLADENNKVIIWASFQKELDDLRYAMTNAGIKCVLVRGGMSQAAVASSVDAFNKDKNIRVYLGQVSTGIGITLNSANYMIYYSLPWSLEHYIQSIDRNYRIGQGNKVVVYRLVGRGTIDESKLAAIEQKTDFMTLVSAKSVCAVCTEYHKRCSKYNIALYGPECKYDRAMERKTALVRLIK